MSVGMCVCQSWARLRLMSCTAWNMVNSIPTESNPAVQSIKIAFSYRFLVWDRLYTHSCVSGGGSQWCMFPVLRIVNETSTWHNPPHWLPDIIRHIGVPDSCSISCACLIVPIYFNNNMHEKSSRSPRPQCGGLCQLVNEADYVS